MLQVNRAIPAVRERQKGQPSDYFCPHQGLIFDFIKGQVIGCNSNKPKQLTKTQNKLLYLLVKRQIDGIAGGWCAWYEIEKRLPPLKLIWDKDDLKWRKRTRDERLDRVQKAISSLRSLIRKVHPYKSLIEYGIYTELEAYRLAAFSACSISPGFCSLELKLL